MNKIKSKRGLILKTFATLFYTLSVICICAGIVGVKITQNNNFESKKVINRNINKTVSTKDLMASFQRITAKIEAEKKAKAEAEARAKEKAAQEAAQKQAASLGTTAPKSEIQQYAHDMVIKQYGWTEADFTGLVHLWNRESGWNPKSYNRYTGACGIPQALPCSKIASAYGSNTWQNQIKWGLRYISGRYGNGANAWAFFQSHGWY
ncbi:MAG: hypothetical protein IJL74_01775 [Bacilli bacterium]|nr:hypothetical protein [Bacilli bacterium]